MEIWKPLKNFPSYDGSNEGRITNVKTRRILKTFTDDKGYIKVCLRKNNKQYTVRVGKVIAETFLDDHPGMDVSYKDLDRANVSVDNLEWRTRSEVVRKSFERGGRIQYRSIPVRVIETDDTFRSVTECARFIGCDKSEILRCLNGKRVSVKGYHFERI